MKKTILIFLSVIGLFAVFSAGWFFHALHGAKSEGPLAAEKIIMIERGMGVSSIAQKLETEGVINSALIFKILSHIDADQRPLKAGEYQFAAHIPMVQALDMIRAGKIYDRKVTIPEGMTSWQIVQTLSALEDMGGDVADIPPEGTLLPQTYHYVGNENRADVLARMKVAMEETIASLWPARMQNLPFSTQNEALVLASIVEKETGVPSERARIAGVFINRLRLGMPLQSDPTVIYALTQGKIQNDGQGPLGRRLLTKDLEISSPYNTYVNTGLPPSPIANPGRAAIEAVLNPERHDYLYFVADGTGGHVFSKSLAEHNENVAKWRKIRNVQP